MQQAYDKLLTFWIMIMAIGLYAVLQATPGCLQKRSGQKVSLGVTENI